MESENIQVFQAADQNEHKDKNAPLSYRNSKYSYITYGIILAFLISLVTLLLMSGNLDIIKSKIVPISPILTGVPKYPMPYISPSVKIIQCSDQNDCPVDPHGPCNMSEPPICTHYPCIDGRCVIDEELNYCNTKEDCLPVQCACTCSGCGGFSYEDVVNKNNKELWYRAHNCIPTAICPEVCCPPRSIECKKNKCVVVTPSPIIELFNK